MSLSPAIENELYKGVFRLRRKHHKYIGCCPFHDEKTPSMHINEVDNGVWVFYCFGCNEYGTINKLLNKIGSDHFLAPIGTHNNGKLIIPFNPMEHFRLDFTKGFSFYYNYYRSRGITKNICDKFSLKFDFYYNRAVMPVYTHNKFMGAIFRNLNPDEIKYSIQDDMKTSIALWGYDKLDKNKKVYITEGIIDAACFWSQGLQAVALIGKNWKEKAYLLKGMHVVCVPDNSDPQSFKTFEGLRRELDGEFCFVPRGYKDVSEYVTS